jgi:hypothetical protein
MVSITKEQWCDNMCSIYAYKSNRKNSKIISDVTIRHLITHNENGACSEEHIMQYFVGIIGQLVTDIKYSSKVINITTFTTIYHMTTYTNANNELYSHNHGIRLSEQRRQFYSIEQLINYLYDILLLIYPYSRIDINDVYNNASIKYFIRLYYNH